MDAFQQECTRRHLGRLIDRAVAAAVRFEEDGDTVKSGHYLGIAERAEQRLAALR